MAVTSQDGTPRRAAKHPAPTAHGPPAPRGRLITLEGIDGAGKSRLAAALVDRLALTLSVELHRELHDFAGADNVRRMLRDPALALCARSEALLFAAARAQLVDERIEPALASGTTVVLDRFKDSALAYQGAGRGLGLDAIRALNAFAASGLTADRTLLLNVPTQAARARQQRRGRADRVEREGPTFFERVAAAYDALARASPERFVVLDATVPFDELLAAATDAVAGAIARPAA